MQIILNVIIIDPNEYPFDTFPDYLCGFYTLLSAARRIHDASHLVPYMSLDDVFATGILREKLGMQLTSATHKTSRSSGVKRIIGNGITKVRPFLFTRGNSKVGQMRELWAFLDAYQ